MAIQDGTKFHGVAPSVPTENRGSASVNARRDAYTIEEISNFAKISESVENTSVSGTYAIDLSKANHELTLTGNTTLSLTNEPTLGQTVVVTLYIASAVSETLTIPAGWTQYGGEYAADGSRNQLALSVSNNSASGLVYDLSISNPN